MKRHLHFLSTRPSEFRNTLSKRVVAGLLGILLVAVPAARAQTTWYVDDDAPGDPGPGDPSISDPLEDGTADHPFDAIQEGTDVAADWDTVVVLDGIYTGPGNKHLRFQGKAITLRSAGGPETCIIDCLGIGKGFEFSCEETADSVLDGFSIVNGNSIDGAILCGNNSSPTIINCVVAHCRGMSGGGLYIDGGSPTITDCVIVNNETVLHGGGISCRDPGAPIIRDCVIAHNRTSDSGGGVRIRGGSAMIERCTITGNEASYYGGGLRLSISGASVRDCAIMGNSARAGGGIYSYFDGDSTITGCTISGNMAEDDGGGVFLRRGSPIVASCSVSENGAGRSGGGVYCSATDATITNCTIAANSANESGGAVSIGDGSDVTLTSSVLWGNAADQGPEIAVLAADDPVVPSTLTTSYSDVTGGDAAAYIEDACTLVWGPGNIDADPLFADPDAADYHLLVGSPCIDAGCNCGVLPDVLDLDGDGDVDEYAPFDLDGEGRFFDDPDTADTGSGLPPIVDMGAYEFGNSDPQPCRGDLDGDFDVDAADLAILLANYRTMSGATGADGDMDCDGDVELSDLAALLGVYGAVCD